MKHIDPKTVRRRFDRSTWTTICAGVVLLVLWGPHACFGYISAESLVAYNPSSQSDDSVVTTLVGSLWSPERQVRKDSERKLIVLAQTSPQKRELVINKLLNVVNGQPELDGTHNILNTSFDFWSSVTKIFAELDATEAVDVLIRCIQCSNGYSGHMGEPPASVALVRMGQAVLQKLSNALTRDPNAYRRMKMVLCIARIGGSEAISALEQRLQAERDKDVRKMIRFNLSQMKSLIRRASGM